MRKPMVAGNWKMHGSREQTASLIGGLVEGLPDEPGCDVLVCPSFPYLFEALHAARGSCVQVGAQDVCADEEGAFTGEVSAGMLRDVGCRHVIVGHSERRTLYGESDALVARKFVAAQGADLVPILCVGESLQEREAGTTEDVVRRQLEAVLDVAGIGAFARALVAYEPIWAIGTGRTASPEQAQEVHAFIRNILTGKDDKIAGSIRLLYGGSVKSANASELFAMADVDGGLVGGASLKADEFIRICEAAE